jgi:putative membrane protein
MLLQWLLAALHLLALGIGLGAVAVRAAALGSAPDPGALRRTFLADTAWGVAAVLWIVTGLWRAFGGVEKGTDYYLSNGAFLLKMALLVAILALEVRPMSTLIRWRVAGRRGQTVDAGAAPALARISWIQAALVVLMVFAATAMARGFWANVF